MCIRNLTGVSSVERDFAKVWHPCKCVAHLESWILSIYTYWNLDVGNVHIKRETVELAIGTQHWFGRWHRWYLFTLRAHFNITLCMASVVQITESISQKICFILESHHTIFIRLHQQPSCNCSFIDVTTIYEDIVNPSFPIGSYFIIFWVYLTPLYQDKMYDPMLFSAYWNVWTGVSNTSQFRLYLLYSHLLFWWKEGRSPSC